MYRLNLEHHFDAAHNLIKYDGACSNLHGHRWGVFIQLVTEKLTKDMVVDFKVLKGVINKLDHKYLNDEVKFNPTAENIAKYIFQEIKKIVNSEVIVEVAIEESPGARITYSEEDWVYL